MSVTAIAFLTGVFLVVVSVLGGGVEVKELKIPNLGMVPRVLTFILGSALIGVCLVWPQLLLGLQRSDGGTSLSVTQQSEVTYSFVNNLDVGVTFEFPSKVLSMDSTEAQSGRILMVDGNGLVRVKITRVPLLATWDIKSNRIRERAELENSGYRVTYLFPKDDNNLKDWYVISVIGNNTKVYFRRWYLSDSIGSIEFTFPKDESQTYEPMIKKMTGEVVFTTALKKAPDNH